VPRNWEQSPQAKGGGGGVTWTEFLPMLGRTPADTRPRELRPTLGLPSAGARPSPSPMTTGGPLVAIEAGSRPCMRSRKPSSLRMYAMVHLMPSKGMNQMKAQIQATSAYALPPPAVGSLSVTVCLLERGAGGGGATQRKITAG